MNNSIKRGLKSNLKKLQILPAKEQKIAAKKQAEAIYAGFTPYKWMEELINLSVTKGLHYPNNIIFFTECILSGEIK